MIRFQRKKSPCLYNKSATRQLNTELNFVSLSFLNFHRNYFMCFDCFYYVPFMYKKKMWRKLCKDEKKKKKMKIRKNVLNFFFSFFFFYFFVLRTKSAKDFPFCHSQTMKILTTFSVCHWIVFIFPLLSSECNFN